MKQTRLRSKVFSLSNVLNKIGWKCHTGDFVLAQGGLSLDQEKWASIGIFEKIDDAVNQHLNSLNHSV